MADTSTDDGPEDGEVLEGLEPKRLSGKKIVLLGGGALLVLLLAGGGAFLLFGGGGEAEEGGATRAAAEPVQLLFVDLPELVVNLNTGERQARYLRARISLEVDSEKDRADVEKKMPRVVDDFQVYLRELRAQDLNGSAGLYRLKEELLVRLNESVAPAQVQDVLFREMLVQ